MVTGFPGSCVTCLLGQGRNDLNRTPEQPQIPQEGCCYPSFGAQTHKPHGTHPQTSLSTLWVPQPITGRWLWEFARGKMLLPSCLKKQHGNLGRVTRSVPENYWLLRMK